jgi:hypothetical protein
MPKRPSITYSDLCMFATSLFFSCLPCPSPPDLCKPRVTIVLLVHHRDMSNSNSRRWSWYIDRCGHRISIILLDSYWWELLVLNDRWQLFILSDGIWYGHRRRSLILGWNLLLHGLHAGDCRKSGGGSCCGRWDPCCVAF